MAADELSREQRLRKQAELQSLSSALANLREREASYMDASANIPDLFSNQIDDVRHQIEELEQQLSIPDEQSSEGQGHEFYREGFRAELAGDFTKALKLYKRAARYSHHDASAAIRSIRYRLKTSKDMTSANAWLPSSTGQSGNRMFLAVIVVLILIFIAVFFLAGPGGSADPSSAIAVEFVATPTTPIVQLIIPNTPTPMPTQTPRSTATPTETARPPTPTPALPTATPTVLPTPTPVPTLRAAPRMIGPRDGLVWLDGAVVFEFEPLDLAPDELYCIDTMRGYDLNKTENWSYSPVGNKQPYIPIEANVFGVARIQGIQCIIWSAGIGKGSCENIVSELTQRRVIGLPRPCDLKR